MESAQVSRDQVTLVTLVTGLAMPGFADGCVPGPSRGKAPGQADAWCLAPINGPNDFIVPNVYFRN